MKRKTRENKKQTMLEKNLTTKLRNSLEQTRKPNGITLIALVVTIVVLLILAGVSISLVLGNNGIIAKAQEAKVATRAGSVEDEVALWRTDNYLAENTNGTAETDEQMIARLQKNNLITDDDEVDTENKIIKIKKSNGIIVKEISYEINTGKQVKINVRKTPETGDATSVGLQVTSVKGMNIISNQDIEKMSLEEKKELIRKTEIVRCNINNGKDFTTFEQFLEYEYAWVQNNKEEAFWEYVGEDLDDHLDYTLYHIADYNWEKQGYEMYIIMNPDGEKENYYKAQENGTYTFTVIDTLNNEKYTKQVEVTNIKQSDYRIDNDYMLIKLIDKSNKEGTTFEKAYILFNEEKIDISSIIRESSGCNYLNSADVKNYLAENGITEEADDIYGTTQTFIIEKDGKEYTGTAYLGMWGRINIIIKYKK